MAMGGIKYLLCTKIGALNVSFARRVANGGEKTMIGRRR
jgi:hypothetical protein